MSHQTGITADEELVSFFGQAKEGQYRVFKVKISNEKLVLNKQYLASSTWQDDFDGCISVLLEQKSPCYLFYRMDSKNNLGYEWIYIAWSPDVAPVKEKMLYAATRATLRQEFGSGSIKDEIFGSLPEDLTLEGYLRHVRSKESPAPRTREEEELERVKLDEKQVQMGVGATAETLPGLSFKVDPSAVDQLHSLQQQNSINYVQLAINIEEEIIYLTHSATIDVSSLPSQVPTDVARYHFFFYDHTHTGQQITSKVFVYSMPGYSCSIKERMLYSSCKAGLLAFVEDKLQIRLDRKLEVDSGAELTADQLHKELHPEEAEQKRKFQKPKGPGGRGPRRMVKPT